MRQRSHPGNGTHICSGTQGRSMKLPVIAIPILAISTNKPLFGARCFIVSQCKDMPEANSLLLKPPLCCNRRCCWGLGSGNFLVTRLFVPDYSITTSQVHIWIAASCWAFSKLSWWAQTLQFGEGRICWKPVDMTLSLGRSSCLRFCNYMWMYCSPAQLLAKKGRFGVFLLCFFSALMWNAHYIVN